MLDGIYENQNDKTSYSFSISDPQACCSMLRRQNILVFSLVNKDQSWNETKGKGLWNTDLLELDPCSRFLGKILVLDRT